VARGIYVCLSCVLLLDYELPASINPRNHTHTPTNAAKPGRPSDAMYTPSSQRVRDGGSPPGDETRERRRSSLFSAFSVGESEGGGRRNSSVWKHATDLWAKRRASTVEVEEVAVED
jgi:hypothetical protein